MIRTPLGLRLNPSQPIREQIREAAKLGAKGVVVDAIGDLAPQRLSETGRREFRLLLRSVELRLIAVSLPTRRPFDTVDQLDDRLQRAESAFLMAYDLGTSLVLAKVGGIPPEGEAIARETFVGAVRELGRRADHKGVRLAIETGPDPGETLRAFLDNLASIGLAASVDPASLLQSGQDPISVVRALGSWIAHAYATDAIGSAIVSTLARRSGFPAGALDWEEYLGALEEVNYQGYLTIWPDPDRPAGSQFTAMVQRLSRF
jgi:sugar phosphate isomerase/epimerase